MTFTDFMYQKKSGYEPLLHKKLAFLLDALKLCSLVKVQQ